MYLWCSRCMTESHTFPLLCMPWAALVWTSLQCHIHTVKDKHYCGTCTQWRLAYMVQKIQMYLLVNLWKTWCRSKTEELVFCFSLAKKSTASDLHINSKLHNTPCCHLTFLKFFILFCTEPCKKKNVVTYTLRIQGTGNGVHMCWSQWNRVRMIVGWGS